MHGRGKRVCGSELEEKMICSRVGSGRGRFIHVRRESERRWKKKDWASRVLHFKGLFFCGPGKV